MTESKPKTSYQNTFLIIHDDELEDPNTNELKSEKYKNDFIEWNDSWKSKPNEVFNHQIRAEDQIDGQKWDKY